MTVWDFVLGLLITLAASAGALIAAAWVVMSVVGWSA